MVLSDLLDQFGTLSLPSEAGAWATHTNAICMDFQQINQEWILLHHQKTNILAMQPHAYCSALQPKILQNSLAPLLALAL